MKPFLGIDCTRDKENEDFNGNEFLVAEVSPALWQEFEEAEEETDEVVQKSKLPLALRIIEYVCGLAGIAIIAGLIESWGEVSWAQAYQNAAALFYIGPACLLIWLALFLLGLHREKSTLTDERSTRKLSRRDGICRAIYTDLGIPDDAQTVDVLMFRYKEKDGEIKIYTTPAQSSTCFNLESKLYADEENFYIADLEGKYAFPRASVRTLREVKKRISFPSWNKEEPFNQGIYKPYKLTANNYGVIFCKSYFILELEHNGEIWGIYFPAYEQPALEKILK